MYLKQPCVQPVVHAFYLNKMHERRVFNLISEQGWYAYFQAKLDALWHHKEIFLINSSKMILAFRTGGHFIYIWRKNNALKVKDCVTSVLFACN